jgi:riboflavin kinase / FMN adenylyltransferase
MLCRHNLPVNTLTQRSVVTWGSFDGMHLGHVSIIKKMKKIAKKKNSQTVVVLFYPPPKIYFSKKPLPQLMSLVDKYLALKILGIDYVLCLRFNDKLAKMNANNFIINYAINKLNCCDLVLGEDAHFGAGRLGSVKSLMRGEWPFTLHVVLDVMIEGFRVSSTRCRQVMERRGLNDLRKLMGGRLFFRANILHVSKKGQCIVQVKSQIPNIEGLAVEVVWIGSRVTAKVEKQGSVSGGSFYRLCLLLSDLGATLPKRVEIYY